MPIVVKLFFLAITRASEGKDQLATVAKLAEKAAIQRGADLLSEAFIYSVAGATVYYEWSMQQREKVQKAAKDAANEAQRREDMRKNEERQWDEFRHLNQRVTMLQEEILDLRRQQQQERDSRGQGWWAWVGSMGKGPSS